MRIKVKHARVLRNALITITSGNHNVVTKNADGTSSAAAVPYMLEDLTRMSLTASLGVAEEIVATADKTKLAIQREIAGGITKDITPAHARFEEWARRTERLEEGFVDKPLLRVRRSGLKEGNDNPVPGLVIQGLRWLLVDDIDAAKKPKAEDIIPSVVSDEEKEQAAAWAAEDAKLAEAAEAKPAAAN